MAMYITGHVNLDTATYSTNTDIYVSRCHKEKITIYGNVHHCTHKPGYCNILNRYREIYIRILKRKKSLFMMLYITARSSPQAGQPAATEGG